MLLAKYLQSRKEILIVMKFAHNAKQRGVEYPSLDNKVTQRGL